MTTPFFYASFRQKQSKITAISFAFLLVALYLLKCRAAWIGIVMAAVIYFGLEYDFIKWAKDKKNQMSVKALAIVFCIILIPIGNQLYNSKKASSDGRKFIWKLSTLMVVEKPLLGYGYGLFEKEYNLFQAQYIEKGKATSEEMQNAGHVLVPHNEIFQNAVEGGLVGLTLLSFFIGSLLVALKSRKSLVLSPKSLVESANLEEDSESPQYSINNNRIFHLSFAGVFAFVIIAMVNVATQCIPAMTMFSIYAAIICCQVQPISLPKWIAMKDNSIATTIKMGGIAISIFLLSSLVNTAIADRQNKKASLLVVTKNYPEALKILQKIQPKLQQYPDYWKNLGLVYYKTKKYSDAIDCLNKAKSYSSDPELFLGKGYSYQKLGQYANAIIQFRLLILTKPSKFKYRNLLMQAYLKNKDIPNAKKAAQEIIDLKPKIPSRKVQYYKMKAKKVVSRS
ncbi:hypothetical protein FFWV33_12550 [Flavobacterium faecale]|uniref:O-antigen ligase-related domain-containing protein n=1 Tax=Flavobacterium faecale TaxID=1355330 RepID=A0A2S1LF17_9FLAO|nr:O-antigen ligase family protein [Flavobacterium faecale]AWG22289.1 hypothetical protein FFWV33_12550 [Flavobacterium faecale]